MASSDIILVSDGEIPNPPVSNAMMARLESLRQQTGMEIHGLLVGKKDSPALSCLCDNVHDFLLDYELRNHMMSVRQPKQTSSTAFYAHSVSKGSVFKPRMGSAKRRYSFSLRATQYSLDGDIFGQCNEFADCKLQRKKEVKATRKQRFSDDEEDWEWGSSGVEPEYNSEYSMPSESSNTASSSSSESNTFVLRLEYTYEKLQDKASQELKKWSRTELDSEIESSSVISNRKVIRDSISFVESGLVEREPQAILVGMCVFITCVYDVYLSHYHAFSKFLE